MSNFPHVATNNFAPTPQNSYIQQQQAFMTGLQMQLERDEITGTVTKAEAEEQEIEELCAEVEPEEENKGFIITSLAVFAGLTMFAVKHGVAFILTLMTYVDSEIAENLLGKK